jgi:hypothetical protein
MKMHLTKDVCTPLHQTSNKQFRTIFGPRVLSGNALHDSDIGNLGKISMYLPALCPVLP